MISTVYHNQQKVAETLVPCVVSDILIDCFQLICSPLLDTEGLSVAGVASPHQQRRDVPPPFAPHVAVPSAVSSVDNEGKFFWIVNQIVCSQSSLFLYVAERENRLLILHANTGTVDRPVKGVWLF